MWFSIIVLLALGGFAAYTGLVGDHAPLAFAGGWGLRAAVHFICKLGD